MLRLALALLGGVALGSGLAGPSAGCSSGIAEDYDAVSPAGDVAEDHPRVAASVHPPDGSHADLALRDASHLDGGSSDGNPRDGGSSDGNPRDGAPADAGHLDGAPADTGHLDGGPADGAPPDGSAPPPDHGADLAPPPPCADPGEPDDSCPGDQLFVDEGETQTVTDRAITGSPDADTFSIHFSEGSHFCFPGTGQSYTASIDVTPRNGASVKVGYNLNACSDSWTPLDGSGLCLTWDGTCAGNDDIDFFFQVTSGDGGACGGYTVTIQFCNEGEHCGGC